MAHGLAPHTSQRHGFSGLAGMMTERWNPGVKVFKLFLPHMATVAQADPCQPPANPDVSCMTASWRPCFDTRRHDAWAPNLKIALGVSAGHGHCYAHSQWINLEDRGANVERQRQGTRRIYLVGKCR